MDTFYQLTSSDQLTGLVWTNIVFSRPGQVWEISEKTTNKIRATFNHSLGLPLGRNRWLFEGSSCSDPGASADYRTLNLHLDVEQPGHFCCDDGTCFNSELVCDNRADCYDKSDERNCSLVVTKFGHNLNRTPLPFNQADGKFSISAVLTILNVYDIDEADSSVDVEFLLQLEWLDSGLMFRFLKEDSNRNRLSYMEEKSIWTPQIIFEVLKKETPTEPLQFFVIRKKPPKATYERDYLESYDGSENPISLVMKRRLIILCPFDFQSFPFGSQSCTFRFYLQGRDNELAELRPTIANIGPPHLGPFNINNWTIQFNYNKFTNTKYAGR